MNTNISFLLICFCNPKWIVENFRKFSQETLHKICKILWQCIIIITLFPQIRFITADGDEINELQNAQGELSVYVGRVFWRAEGEPVVRPRESVGMSIS